MLWELKNIMVAAKIEGKYKMDQIYRGDFYCPKIAIVASTFTYANNDAFYKVNKSEPCVADTVSATHFHVCCSFPALKTAQAVALELLPAGECEC